MYIVNQVVFFAKRLFTFNNHYTEKYKKSQSFDKPLRNELKQQQNIENTKIKSKS